MIKELRAELDNIIRDLNNTNRRADTLVAKIDSLEARAPNLLEVDRSTLLTYDGKRISEILEPHHITRILCSDIILEAGLMHHEITANYLGGLVINCIGHGDGNYEVAISIEGEELSLDMPQGGYCLGNYVCIISERGLVINDDDECEVIRMAYGEAPFLTINHQMEFNCGNGRFMKIA